MRAAGSKDYISLVKGLITEASSLAFPEGATSDELNFTINRDGLIRKRRLGFDNLVPTFDLTGNGVQVENAFYWRGPSIVGVIVIDNTPQTLLRFHAVDADFTLLTEIPVASTKVTTQFAQTTNLLVITTDDGEKPLLCEYEENTGNITVYSVDLYIRDFEVVDDDLAVSTRPSGLTDNHEYNLYNAGWYQTRPDADAGNAEKNVAQAFKDKTGFYPSNADVSSVGIIDDGNGNLVFDSEYVEQADFGNSLAPRGHYVYKVTDIDRLQRQLAPNIDGTTSTTLTVLGTTDISGSGTFDPDNGGGTGGGGEDPYDPGDEFVRPPGTELP